MGSRSWAIVAVIIVASLAGIYYLSLSSKDEIQDRIPEWLVVDAEATYIQTAILSPGIFDDYRTIVKWRVADFSTESISLEITDERGTGLTTVELDGPGNPYFCLFNIQVGESENSVVVESTMEFENFGSLRVYETIFEAETAFWYGIYEADTGILLQMDVRGKGEYAEGEPMGLFTQLQSINVDFKTG